MHAGSNRSMLLGAERMRQKVAGVRISEIIGAKIESTKTGGDFPRK